MNSTVFDQTFNSARYPIYNALELAARNVDKCLISDNSAPSLLELMNVNSQTGPTASGLTDNDYPNLSGLSSTLNNITQIKTHSKVPLPPEIMEHLSHFQYHCMMGLFPEIHRAWLTIDSDIYVWTYEDSSDVAYYDGINDTILSVGLVHPKPGVFHAFIKYLLVLTTSTDIVVLGVTFTAGANSPIDEIQLVPEPVFVVPTDGSTITTITGTNSGRLFLGSKEGYIYEIVYQAESGWFGKRCKKVNRSDFPLSFLIPSFINATLTEEDSILQFSIDNSRNILYTLTAKGSIESYDMGQKGDCFTRNSKLSQSRLVARAVNAVKTLDSQNFRPIVSISAVEAHESLYIHLVAVSQTGVRFYLSGYRTFGLEERNNRPGELDLVHVRLPPGYSANVTIRPRSVHMATYRDRNLLLVSSVNEKDVLWCLSSDLFPFSSNLMEVYNLINLEGPVLALSEVKQTKNQFHSTTAPAPPLIVRQHFEAQRKYVVLTPHGVHILSKLRPVDVLRQILVDSHGQDTDAIKIFFSIQKEDQACATTLILASLDSFQNKEISEWATRVFFMFGGEPKLPPTLGGTNMNQSSFVSPRFSPNIISTPVSGHYQSRINFSPSTSLMQQQANHPSAFDYNSPFYFSAKHNGLYLFLSRILRPVWNLHCVQKVTTADGKQTFYTNTITSDECIWIMGHLNALHRFLLLNTQLSTGTTSNNQLQHSTTFSKVNYTIQDAQVEERQSLDALKNLINHCLQVLGLWKILCEHQFHVLIGSLAENYQNMLQNTTFKDLFLYGHELCSVLIITLINSYLGDNASIDSISIKLREVCPNLYKSEDAAYSKANEILKSARNVENPNERDELLQSALQLCKSIAPNVNLQEICKQFTVLKYYEAVTDLCVMCANKVDPDKVAEHYYNKKLQPMDEASHFYSKRMEIYKEILNMLDAIYTEMASTQVTFKVPETTLIRSEIQTGPQQVENNVLLYNVLNDILRYEDELLQVAIYEWMISKKLYNDLIKIEEPSLERYLIRESEKKSDDFLYMDLLWKYYESNNNHSAAAKVLNNLASQASNCLTLKDRLAYLARSVMCMRSDKVGYTPCYGVFLRELEDKIEIGKVQEEILDAIMNIRDRYPNAEEAIVALNSGLYDITQLYEDFADPFELWECKLAIIECAGYNDVNVVQTIWYNILQNEVRHTTGTGSDKLNKILFKVKILARRYKNSTIAFPIDYVIRELELLSSKLRADASLVPKCFLSINLPVEDLLNLYTRLVASSLTDRYWQTEENEFHYTRAVTALINGFIDTHNNYNNADKRRIISLCEDLIAMLLSYLYSKPNADVVTNTLRNIKLKLSQI